MFLFKRSLQSILLAIVAAFLSACASVAQPNEAFGYYFMSGDDSCKRMTLYLETRVRCYDSAGRFTQFRDALSNEQMARYSANRREQALQMQQLTNQLESTGASWQRATQSIQNAPVYTPPAVQPIYQPGQGQVRCITAGIYTNCRY